MLIINKKNLVFYLFLILIGLLFPKKVQSVFNFNIASSSATTITSGAQEIEVILTIEDLPDESYFRVSLQKESGGSYYGYLSNNNNEWTKIQTLSGDCSGYYKVTDITITSLMLKYKIGDDVEFTNGNYNLKSHRFTKSCNSYAEATNLLPIKVNFPSPTPTPTLEPTDTPQPTATPTPTQAPTPTTTPAATPTLKPTIAPTMFKTELDGSESANFEEVLGTQNSDSQGYDISLDGATESAEGLQTNKKKINFWPLLFIVPGAGMVSFSLLVLAKQKKPLADET